MLRLARVLAPLRLLGPILLGTAAGCVDSASLCEARLTPINVPVTAAEAPAGRGTHP